MNVPQASKKPKQLVAHDDVRIDNFYWLNNREDQEVIDYLNTENAFYEEKTKHTKPFQEALFTEMKSRIKEDDTSVPYKYNGYWYIVRFETGKDYPIYIRKKETLEASEELLFDCNEMAKEFDYFKLSGINISPDNKLAAFGVDTVSRRQYTIKIKNLETGELYPETIESTTGGSTWANDNKTLFYTRKDAITLRSDKIYKHLLNSPITKDTLIFNEKDETYTTHINKSKSKKYLIISSQSTLTTEYQILDANTPDGEFKLFHPRTENLEYYVSHYQDHFYILNNNDGAKNYKLSKTKISQTNSKYWEDVIEHRENTLLEDLEIFKEYLVINERTDGLNKIRIMRWDKSQDYYLPFNNETYTAYTSTNIDFDTETLRYNYNALTTPNSTIDFNMRTKESVIKKEQEVLGGVFNKENYTSERVWAKASDDTKIPISLVYKKGIKLSGSNPLLIYAYGAYGSTIDPYFSTIRLSLLDRGFIYAIAHVRGGEYLGRRWYENGKLFNKKNTFTDFIVCSEYLVEKKYTSSEHLYAMGGSAGGLLIGAVINMAPKLYKGVVAAVPFVDVVTTMLDDTIPLTTGEYDEWGNPNKKAYYDYIKSYSPYDNVEDKQYPNILVTTGLHDSQVQYWEPAKWVAKLRYCKANTSDIFLKTNMKTGHGGASGRFEVLKEYAEEYAFLLDMEGITS